MVSGLNRHQTDSKSQSVPSKQTVDWRHTFPDTPYILQGSTSFNNGDPHHESSKPFPMNNFSGSQHVNVGSEPVRYNSH